MTQLGQQCYGMEFQKTEIPTTLACQNITPGQAENRLKVIAPAIFLQR
jgi:UDP-N-acetylglucosamine:LPS N-acetylglucosamine transferase